MKALRFWLFFAFANAAIWLAGLVFSVVSWNYEEKWRQNGLRRMQKAQNPDRDAGAPELPSGSRTGSVEG
jgi:hypothetical protein